MPASCPWATESVASWPASRPRLECRLRQHLASLRLRHAPQCLPPRPGWQGREALPAPSLNSLCFALTGGSAQTAPVGPGGQAPSSRAASPQLPRCDVPALPRSTWRAALWPSLSGLRTPDVSFLSGAEESGQVTEKVASLGPTQLAGCQRPVVQDRCPTGPTSPAQPTALGARIRASEEPWGNTAGLVGDREGPR